MASGDDLPISTHMLRLNTDREHLGEETPVTLPSLKIIQFEGVGSYLESLVAEFRAPF